VSRQSEAGSIRIMAPDPTTTERNARNASIMTEMRAHGGKTEAGQTLVILTITGAKTGRTYDKPVCVREDGADLVVAASAGGQARHPLWYRNLVAHPEITVEYLDESFPATASTVANSLDRDRLFQMLSEEITGLYGYQDRCRESRQIPIIRLERT
jgi:deazaflavin-dependent oxidoreductase (nitroreductase family)